RRHYNGAHAPTRPRLHAARSRGLQPQRSHRSDGQRRSARTPRGNRDDRSVLSRHHDAALPDAGFRVPRAQSARLQRSRLAASLHRRHRHAGRVSDLAAAGQISRRCEEGRTRSLGRRPESRHDREEPHDGGQHRDRYRNPLMRIVVIGAGVVGASVAYHLAARGIRDVVVLDRANGPGGGSTPRATGGFRVQFGTTINIALSLLAREKLLRFEEELGVDSGYRPYGYLFLAKSEAALHALRTANELQHANDAPEPQLIDGDEARRINPAIEDEGVIGAAYGPRDGFIRAMQILNGYTEGAKRLGVR